MLNIDVIEISGGSTGILQPLDVVLMKPIKQKMKRYYLDWQSNQMDVEGTFERTPSKMEFATWIQQSIISLEDILITQSFEVTGVTLQMCKMTIELLSKDLKSLCYELIENLYNYIINQQQQYYDPYLDQYQLQIQDLFFNYIITVPLQEYLNRSQIYVVNFYNRFKNSSLIITLTLIKNYNKNHQLQNLKKEKSKTQKIRSSHTMPPKQQQNIIRRAQGTPKSSTSFNKKTRSPSRNGRRGRSRSQSSRKSSQSASQTRRRQIPISWTSLSNSKDSRNSSKSYTSRDNWARLHTKTCKFWNNSRCTKGENCEFAHFHLKFFHKTQNFQTKGKAQIINQQYQTQINDGKVLVEVKQLKFLKWTEVQQLAQNLAQGVLEQAVSIATINKNAERNYKKELKQLKQIDDDPTHSLNLKVNAFNKYYDKLIKTDTKSDAAKKYQSNKSSQQKIDQKSNSNQNQNQSERMDVEYMKTNKNNNQKKNNQQKSPHNPNQVAHHLDPIELNDLAKHAKENETFPDDTQHRLVSKNLELNQMWDSRLIQMFTNEPYYIQQMLDSAKIQSRDLRKKIKYGIYINAYLLYILKQNFGRQEFEVEEGVYHNIALLMLIPIIKLLKSQQVIDQSDKVNTQGLMEVLYQAYQLKTLSRQNNYFLVKKITFK
ncbi:hypothetical protein ABPG72_018695 [Tetrahymena utriculariae]